MPTYAHRSRALPRRDDPEAQVLDLVSKYKDIGKPRPVLREIVGKPETYELLGEIVEHQITLVKSRSQAFEDSHITVYDKALLVLSNNGNEISNVGSMELYIEEFLGIDPDTQFQTVNAIVHKHVALKALFVKSSKPRGNGSAGKSAGNDLPKIAYTSQDSELKVSSQDGDQTDDKITRILNVYFKAKEDYYRLTDVDSARFLRDTAENTLNCLRARDLSTHKMVPELERMFQYAKDKATALLGGKKRRFEIMEFTEVPVKRRRGGKDRYVSRYYRP